MTDEPSYDQASELRRKLEQKVKQVGWDKVVMLTGGSKTIIYAMIDGRIEMTKRVISYLGYEQHPYYKQRIEK